MSNQKPITIPKHAIKPVTDEEVNLAFSDMSLRQTEQLTLPQQTDSQAFEKTNYDETADENNETEDEMNAGIDLFWYLSHFLF